MIGKDGKTAVATLVERTSRFLILVPLTGRDSLTVGEAIIAATGGLPAQIRRSLTWDCGAEMARHATITATGLPVYFAHPHSPWERGSNENLNVSSQGVPPGDHAVWGGIQGLADRASRMASMGRRPWLRALTR